MRKTLIILLLLLLAFAGGFLTRHLCHFSGVSTDIKVKVDTIIVNDTIRLYEPKIIERTQTDTLWQIVENTKEVHDTLYVPLPMERVVYQDTSYRAVVSGFRPRLDSLEIYRRDKVVTVQTEKVVTISRRTRWGVGVQAGYGLTPAGFQPYVGLGVSYNLLAW